ncbi:MAG: response regulator [Methylococcaceae bacterium]|nr:response regulator [Methylococcaceae bacterium]
MKKILIVDDEPHIALVLKQFLERAGLEILTTLNGKLAIDIIKKEHPTVIITDVQMPIMGGIELCETLQRIMPDYQPLIILMTSRLDRDIRNWVKQHMSVNMMEKPLSMRRLLAKINNHLANFKA